MNRYIFTILTLLVIVSRVNAQVEFWVEEIEVYSIIIHDNENSILEARYDGPGVSGTISFQNTSDSIVRLDLPNSKTSLTFRYQEKDFISVIIGKDKMFNNAIDLDNNQKVCLYFSADLFHGTSISKSKNEVSNTQDYSREVIQVLPTIHIWYRDKNFDIKTSSIKNVRIIDPKH